MTREHSITLGDALIHIANDGAVTFPDDVEIIEVGARAAWRLTSPHLPSSVRIEQNATVIMASGVMVNVWDAVSAFLARP